MKTPILSIIIVHYKTPQLLLNCIQSIYQSTNSNFLEIIVIDNNSEDCSEERIQNKFSKVKWYNAGYNSGFSRANNLGIKKAQGKYTLLLNSDTIVNEDALNKCIEYIKLDSRIGLLGCKLLNKDGTTQFSAYPQFHSIKKTIKANPFYIALNRNLKMQTKYSQTNDLIYEPAWICGAFMLFDTNLIKENSFYFDEDFFMYSEDVELCYRITQSGFKIIYYSEASIIHLNGGSNKINNSRAGQILISEWLYILKTKGKLYYFFLLFLTSLNLILDDFLFYKKKLLKNTTDFENDGLLYRKFVKKNLIKFGMKIFWNYTRKKSSAEKCLKYNI